MLATEMFVKLCSIMVMDALISGMRTSIASGSELAHPRPGTESSRLNHARKRVGPWHLVTVFVGWLL